MIRTTHFLDPKRKLVDAAADWLCAGERVRTTPEGAHSLAHLLVVVPTAQSGRNLRLALARRAAERNWGGLLPPRIEMANALLEPKGVRVATPAEELAVMAEVLLEHETGEWPALFPRSPRERTAEWALGMAEMILGIESILGEKALRMSDVKPALDLERWRDLAALEEAFFAALRARHVEPRCLARRQAVAAGCREDGVEEIVLPSAVDVPGAFVDYLVRSPQRVSVLLHADWADAEKFDDWGRPTAVFPAALDPQAIDSAPTAVVESDDVARFFRAVKPGEAFPALAVCDAEMHPELEGAFQNHFSAEELVLRNPSRERLAISSLGRLLAAILRLEEHGDYETFSTFVRMGDVARWARSALNASAEEVAAFTGALDAVQNAHLPRTLDEALAGAEADAQTAWRANERAAAAGLARLIRAVKAEMGDPLGYLGKIFATVTLDEKNPADRELVAAAETVRNLRGDCASELVPERLRRRLFLRLLKSASFVLEPVAENVLATSGWLEVPWCAEDELVLAGFNEGCVPENVVGHPFVPDALRADLGLTTNAAREFRDSFILAEAARCRAKGALSLHLHQIAGDKSVMKPSRLLFNGISTADLPALALRLYTVTKGGAGVPTKAVPPAWRLKLPVPPKGTVFREKISPTELDRYLKCPFNFYLTEVFGEHADDRNQELDARAFGTLCHAALEAFAKTGPKDSTDPDEIAAFLADEVRRRLRAFGTCLPAIIELQGEAAIARLRAFSGPQAARRRAGWRILEAEQKLRCRIKGCPTLLSGTVDRIDRHEETGDLEIVDYKTWDRPTPKNFESIQLPVYRAMVEASGRYDPAKAHAAKARYCILAARAEDTLFDETHVYHEGNQSEKENEVVALLAGVARGIFYPPGPDGDWKREYLPLVGELPEEGVDPEWLADQQRRIADRQAAGEVRT